jgi:hypothetical protein
VGVRDADTGRVAQAGSDDDCGGSQSGEVRTQRLEARARHGDGERAEPQQWRYSSARHAQGDEVLQEAHEPRSEATPGFYTPSKEVRAGENG